MQCNCPVCAKRPFTKELKGDLSVDCRRAFITGSVYALVPDSETYPVPYGKMTLVSLTRKRAPVAYVLFQNEAEIERFPEIKQALSDKALKLQVEGCLHTLRMGGGRRTIGKGPLRMRAPTEGRTPGLLFDVTSVNFISQ